MKVLKSSLILFCVAVLAGCVSSGEDEVRQWISEERAQAKPRVTPIAEPKQFKPEAYTADVKLEPFNPLKLTQALRRDSTQLASNAALIAPEMARRKEPLEAYPLDTIKMVGSLQKKGQPAALVTADKLLYQVAVGQYLGQSYGRITSINETAIQLREIVQDATGDWIERTTSLELQEGVTK
ncbi:pilus assembly protein PilP [Acidovorax sp. LjRoot66]|uniref:pilus assembly protein PilP n=1 Tax=Acidovorax sp. LjRoot66 TaxID=3342334 RepID=UPI003ED0FA01